MDGNIIKTELHSLMNTYIKLMMASGLALNHESYIFKWTWSLFSLVLLLDSSAIETLLISNPTINKRDQITSIR